MVKRHLRLRGAAAAALAVAARGTAIVQADSLRFADFTPLPASSGPTATEATPITFGNPDFQQESIISRQAQLADGIPNSGNST